MYSKVPEAIKALKRRVASNAYDFVTPELARTFHASTAEWEDGVALDNSFDRHLYRGLSFSGLPSYLRYEDKNSMAHSVESRLPFLDYRLAEFAFSLSWREKIHDATTKQVVRQAMKGILPETVRNRRDKVGFLTPEDIWFRTDACDNVVAILESESFRMRPFFNYPKVKKHLAAHLQGDGNRSAMLWRCINLELWLSTFIDQQI